MPGYPKASDMPRISALIFSISSRSIFRAGAPPREPRWVVKQAPREPAESGPSAGEHKRL